MADKRYLDVYSTLNTSRTRISMPTSVKTTLNAGDLVPLKIIEVLPGDSINVDMSAVCRELTLLNPPMDNAYLQVDFFFCSQRLLFNQTKEFFGETDEAFEQPPEITLPHGNLDLSSNINLLKVGTIGDYMGLPIDVEDTAVETFNYLPLRAYALIWNYWYRSPRIQDAIVFGKDNDLVFGGSLSKGYASQPLKVGRFGDLFTSCLPEPQFGDEVNFISPYLPVIPIDLDALPDGVAHYSDVSVGDPLRWGNLSGTSTQQGTTRINSNNIQNTTSGTEVAPANLYASTLNSALNNINGLRLAIATAHYREALGRFGNLYDQSIKALFNVETANREIQVPDYIGGYKQLLNVDQVLATAQGTEYTVGSTGAFSNTGFNKNSVCTSSFTEYGYVVILAHIRTDNTYSQGVPKLFSKKYRDDIYNPCFANIGNVPVLTKELYFTDDTETDNTVFGYQEAWYDYRYLPNTNTGYMRADTPNGLETWTYQRVFSTQPVLNSDFVSQTSDEIARTLAISDTSLTHQFKLDTLFDIKMTRVMPLYSVPGLQKI